MPTFEQIQSTSYFRNAILEFSSGPAISEFSWGSMRGQGFSGRSNRPGFPARPFPLFSLRSWSY